MHWLVLLVPRDQHAQQLELLFSGRTRSAHLSHFHKDNTSQVWTVCYGCCPLHHHAVFPSLQDSEPTNKIQIISTTKMPTHLIDSQLARFRTNPLEPFDKVNIGIKSILASHVIQSKNLANALDRHNICSWVFLFAQHVCTACLHNTNKETGEHDFALIAASLNSTSSSTWMRSAWSSMIQFMRLFLQFT